MRRYAFVGDSFTYGLGVAPHQTLPAYVEQRLNEFIPEWPIEAVNFGIPGYNLWNNWRNFEAGPCVYDGVIIVLCHNDAQLFGRGFKVSYKEPYQHFWRLDHPYRQIVLQCLDEISTFAKDLVVPVAVCYYNYRHNEAEFEVAAIINDICKDRDILFIDPYPYLREKNIAPERLRVSKADGHPSAIAHNAVANHIADMLRHNGWFTKDMSDDVTLTPGRIAATAGAMILNDHYAPDQARHWALSTLETKSRVARRLATTGRSGGFGPAYSDIVERLTIENHRWHVTHRVSAFMADVATGGYGIDSCLWTWEDLRSKLDELGFALASGSWTSLSFPLLNVTDISNIPSTSHETIGRSLGEVISFDFSGITAALARLSSIITRPSRPGSTDPVPAEGDCSDLFRLLYRIQTESSLLSAAFHRFQDILTDAAASLFQEDLMLIWAIIEMEIPNAAKLFKHLSEWPCIIDKICSRDVNAFTTIEVTLNASTAAVSGSCSIKVSCEFIAPNRASFTDGVDFLADSTDQMVNLYVPVIYIGRIILSPLFSSAIDSVRSYNAMNVTLKKVVAYNHQERRRVIAIESFYLNTRGQYVSQIICLN